MKRTRCREKQLPSVSQKFMLQKYVLHKYLFAGALACVLSLATNALAESLPVVTVTLSPPQTKQDHIELFASFAVKQGWKIFRPEVKEEGDKVRPVTMALEQAPQFRLAEVRWPPPLEGMAAAPEQAVQPATMTGDFVVALKVEPVPEKRDTSADTELPFGDAQKGLGIIRSRWLACSKEECIPGDATLLFSLPKAHG